MRHEWTDPVGGRRYAVENGNLYEMEAKGPRLIEGRQVSNREILRLAELVQYHEGRSFDNAALAYQWMCCHFALLALLQEHAPAALLAAKLPPTPSPEGTEALARLSERVADLELTLDTVREHERGKERECIRRALLAELGPNRIIIKAGKKNTLAFYLDRICPEE